MVPKCHPRSTWNEKCSSHGRVPPRSTADAQEPSAVPFAGDDRRHHDSVGVPADVESARDVRAHLLEELGVLSPVPIVTWGSYRWL